MILLKLLLVIITLIFNGYAKDSEKFRQGHYYLEYVKYFPSADISYYRESSKNLDLTGTIEGYVIYKGKKLLKNKRKLITKDKKVCGRGFKVDKVYVLGNNKGVKNAVVFIQDINIPSNNNVLLVQKKCEFHPRIIALTAGDNLIVKNEDPVKHEATGVQDFETIFKLSQHKKGMIDKVQLDKPGVVKITCSIHGWMLAWAIVSPNPFHSITNEKGKFIIKNVPEGNYTLKMWHEGFGEKELRVKVEKNKITKVYFEIE